MKPLFEIFVNNVGIFKAKKYFYIKKINVMGNYNNEIILHKIKINEKNLAVLNMLLEKRNSCNDASLMLEFYDFLVTF